MTDFKALIGKVASGKSLTRGEAEAAFNVMMSGEATPSQMGAFLMALRVRGETVDEIAGAVATMRAKMLRVEAPPEAIDVVGTGGDGTHTYNISTASAFVVAGAGVPVAKHGNRALSSRSGAADVLTALGVKIDLTPELVGRCIREAGIGFMFAPAAPFGDEACRADAGRTRHADDLQSPRPPLQSGRRQAAAHRHLLAAVAGAGGGSARRPRHRGGWVVHGDSGVDEISITGPTQVAELKGGRVETFEVAPGDVGLKTAPLEAIKGGDAKENAEALRGVLNGAAGAYRDTVLMNAGAALLIAGKASDLKDGVRLAAASIDEGHARYRLKCLIAVSHG